MTLHTSPSRIPKAKLVSPWIARIQRKRPVAKITESLRADVAIIGAGIAGISTAYFLLQHTKQRVLLIDADRVAHGATGHNAGQLVSYFERPFHDIAEEFGLDMAAAGQRGVDSAWELLDDIRHDMRLQTPCQVFTGYAGCVDMDVLLSHLRDNAKKRQAGLPFETVFVAANFAKKHKIPRTLRSLYTIVPHNDILRILETKDRRYVAALAGKKGCMNSARFCEELVTALLKRYPKRLQLAERTPVHTLKLYADHAILKTDHYDHVAARVVLCTNGFERMTIANSSGGDIDMKFHHLVRGSVGYMAAFIEEPLRGSAAVSYLPAHAREDGAYDTDPYFYVTRRPHSRPDEAAREGLVCVGGPEMLLDDTTTYSRAHPYSWEARALIDDFLKRTYVHAGTRLTYAYFWHGLMGYTPNGIRCIGTEPCNPVLLYNLGCNGVGILPSVYGGFRIAQILRGDKLDQSIFDPQDQRCGLPFAKRSPNVVIISEKWLGRHAIAIFAVCWIIATAAVLGAFVWQMFLK